MLRTCIGLFILGLLVLPAVAQDKKKPDVDKDKDKDKDEVKVIGDSKKKLVSAGKLVGKLTQVEGTTKFLTLQVTAKIQVPNPDALRNSATYQRQLAEASLDRNPVNRQRRLAEIQYNMARNQANLYSVKEHHHKVELQAADDMKVRIFNLPVEFDDKGKPRKYTAKELSDLKGPDPKLPGYAAEYENLRAGQEVEVTFLRPKTVARPKSKDKDRDLVAEDERLKATLIVILRDPPAK